VVGCCDGDVVIRNDSGRARSTKGEVTVRIPVKNESIKLLKEILFKIYKQFRTSLNVPLRVVLCLSPSQTCECDNPGSVNVKYWIIKYLFRCG
jgi:hypothetical protein